MPVVPTGPRGELSDQDAALVRQAGERARKIRRAAGVAAFNGWTAALFALTALLGGFFSLPALVLGVGLAIGAFLELRGRSLLLAFDARGPRLLAINQAVFAGSVTIYCLWSMARSLQVSPETMQVLNDPSVDEAVQSTFGQSASSLVSTVAVGVYGLVIVLTGIFQGLMAFYYLSRARLLAEHRRLTPPWIADMQRRLAA